jgi:hypothetical protein
MEECANCGHDEGHHRWSEEHRGTICDGDGFFDAAEPGEPPDPQCDCDLFEEEEEYEEEEED